MYKRQTYDVDGHDIPALVELLKHARQHKQGVPQAIIAHTVKGKGISFMENQVGWHGKAPNDQQLHDALAELEQQA